MFYRSSYELEFCKILDLKKLEYNTEMLRIKYFDTQQNKERMALPDFYLPKINLIVEIKSSYTLNEKEMEDKVKRYKELGYDVDVLVNLESINN